jgi:hypothetical protein
MKIIFRGLCAFTEWSSSDPQKQGRFTVLMPKSGMAKMPGMAMHHAALCIPVTGYTSSTVEPASIVPGGMVPSDAQWQPYGTPLAVWNLEGCELSVLQDPAPVTPSVSKLQAVGYKALTYIPSLADANGGDDRVDPRCVIDSSPSLTARVQLVGGSITALPPAHPVMTCEKWSFGTRTNVPYTDQVFYEPSPAQNYKLVVSDLADSTNAVQIEMDLGATALVTHLAQTPSKDHFKMYWSLLINPNAALPVPQDGQRAHARSIVGFSGLTSQYPGDCLNSYAHVDI